MHQINDLPELGHRAWTAAFEKEVKALVDNDTFDLTVLPEPDEQVVPTTDLFRAKLKSDGTIDKLKVRIAARGDLDKGSVTENNWAPLASLRLVKIFLADAARDGNRIFQIDFVAAFLQARVDRRIFVKMPASWGKVLPKFSPYFGRPLLLKRALYGLTSAGRLFSQDLYEWLIYEYHFRMSDVDTALLVYRDQRSGHYIKLIQYCDDLLYQSSSMALKADFEKKLAQRFQCDLLGQAHWFLQARVTQHADFSITLDQSRYVLSIIRRFLPTHPVKSILEETRRQYRSPLPAGFVFTKDDLSATAEAVKALEAQFGFRYQVVIGCLIWVINTLSRIQFAVRKLAKAMASPGRLHFEAVIHLLHHLRCFPDSGLKFYSKPEESPFYQQVLKPRNLPLDCLCYTVSDSSFQDCPNTGRSTRGYVIYYQGGVIEASSSVPVALSSAEAESNMGALASRATAYIRMLLLDLRGLDPDLVVTVPLLLDNSAAQSIGHTFRNTEHTRHIARRWFYTRSQIQLGFIRIYWIPNEFMVADALTKNLDGANPSFLLHRYLAEHAVPL